MTDDERTTTFLLRSLPSVHELAAHALVVATGVSHQQRVTAARQTIDDWRAKVRDGHGSEWASVGLELETLARAVVAAIARPCVAFRRVLNATGVVLHTNLGRAPIAAEVWRAMQQACGYCDVELDLVQGKRASRLRHVDGLLRQVTGAAAGVVFNNNAAAVLIVLAALAGKRATAVSRGHLVEIGGGFRLPTIMEASGSPLMEIGTANRTHLYDYEEALDRGAGLILLVHRSNFTISGYVSEPSFAEIIALCRQRGVPVAFDLGSGLLAKHSAQVFPSELGVAEAVAAGFDAVCFSGDKLMGGPQAGYVVGAASAVETIRRHPLARALRCDKVQLAGCLATLDLYARRAEDRLPIFKGQSQDVEARARAWQDQLGCGEVVAVAGAVGGGTLPEVPLPGFALAIEPRGASRAALNADGFLRRLRRQEPPIVAHIDKQRVLLHPRTVDPGDDGLLFQGLRRALAGEGTA